MLFVNILKHVRGGEGKYCLRKCWGNVVNWGIFLTNFIFLRFLPALIFLQLNPLCPYCDLSHTLISSHCCRFLAYFLSYFQLASCPNFNQFPVLFPTYFVSYLSLQFPFQSPPSFRSINFSLVSCPVSPFFPLFSCPISTLFHSLSLPSFLPFLPLVSCLISPIVSCSISSLFYFISLPSFLSSPSLFSCPISPQFHVLSLPSFMSYLPLVSCPITPLFLSYLPLVSCPISLQFPILSPQQFHVSLQFPILSPQQFHASPQFPVLSSQQLHVIYPCSFLIIFPYFHF